MTQRKDTQEKLEQKQTELVSKSNHNIRIHQFMFYLNILLGILKIQNSPVFLTRL
jgi:hypothetical protein